MTLRHIVVRPEGTDELLAPYGVVFPVTPGDERIPVPLDADGAGRGAFTATVIRARACRAVGPLNGVERHPYSVQAFVPLGACRLVVVAAPPGPAPSRLDQLPAIHVPAGWGIAYRPGVWHTWLMGVGMEAALVSMVRRLPDGSDTEFATLPFSIEIDAIP
jgi:ureidoglycolate hydrolase